MSNPDTGNFYNADEEERRVADEVHEYLAQLDKLRADSERRGNFLKAHECVNRMREVNLRFARRLEKKSQLANVDTKRVLAEEHKRELLTFSRIWEDKLRDFDDQAETVLAELKAKHADDYAAQEGILRVQLMNRRPRFSRRVVELRAHMERCVALRDYLSAEEAKRELLVLEQREIAEFDVSLEAAFERRSRMLKGQYVNELRAVEQKIDVGREELLTARAIEFEKMVRRHENVLRDLDAETKLHVVKTKQYIQRQVTAMVQDPVKTGLELRGVAATVRNKTPSRPTLSSRSSTPPAAGSSRARLVENAGSWRDSRLVGGW